jgi:Arsenical pump membrane protein
MAPVNGIAVAASLLVLFLYFRKDIPARYDPARLRTPRDAIRDPVTFRAGWIVLSLLLAGFFILEPLGVPVSVVTTSGAVGLLLIAGRLHIVGTRRIMRQAPWHIVIFGYVLGGLWLTQRRFDQLLKPISGTFRRTWRMGRGAGNRIRHSRAFFSNEQFADRTDWRAIHFGYAHQRARARSDDLRKRHRQQSGTKNYLYRQLGHIIMATHTCSQRLTHYLGVLL